ncbi:hypothetical protein AJ79_09478 [Helicocarpus griseus UAMH5409]|uniref:Uncharacterized protein n=1 Tax=Helicocarpus griseus UAMH5409 TaxID=1447875 RepID=A0A2B7WJJ1_9EURO|nr:hypothetical protein AJ79_09478 [Helicocarpus griseus UAMH5409]
MSQRYLMPTPREMEDEEFRRKLVAFWKGLVEPLTENGVSRQGHAQYCQQLAEYMSDILRIQQIQVAYVGARLQATSLAIADARAQVEVAEQITARAEALMKAQVKVPVLPAATQKPVHEDGLEIGVEGRTEGKAAGEAHGGTHGKVG